MGNKNSNPKEENECLLKWDGSRLEHLLFAERTKKPHNKKVSSQKPKHKKWCW